ncbi:AMP-binding protein [Streptomyces varsoviensis]|nr:AMP-binding protein [Streptomyces varsoviensis]
MTSALRSTASLSDLLIRNAAGHPDRPALSDGDRTFDYRSLDVVAGHVAARLSGLGVGRGDRVALFGARDARMCALLYGVLRSGAAAVLVDAGWSAADVLRRLASVEARCALTTTPAIRAPEPYGTEVLDIDALAVSAPVESPAADRCRPADIAYLSFTSGSRGEPKAVAVTHANTVHYAQGLRDRLGLTDADAPCVAHVTTLAADLGHTAWLLALATAGSVHVVPDDRARDPESFWATLRAAGVSVLKTTPSHLTALLPGRPGDAPALDTVLLGGEPLPRALAAGLLQQGVAARVANHYGPTETTVGATCFLASSAAELPADEPTVPIGTAIGETELRLVPAGPEGELHIGGRGVSAGYFGRPEETARSFIQRDGAWVYRTGDVCRRRPDGNLVFVGRSDRQVKVRGYRVDPVEIEHAVERFPGVAQSAVIVRDTPTGRQLLAAVRLSEGHEEAATIAALGSYLRDRLPGYSVPQPILAVPHFPYGPNGKLDRERLATVVTDLIATRARGAGRGGTELGGAGRGVVGQNAAGQGGAGQDGTAHDVRAGGTAPEPAPTAGAEPGTAGTGPETATGPGSGTDTAPAAVTGLPAAGPESVPDPRPTGRAEEPLTRAIAELWAEALGLPVVDAHADVLSLGGDSILAMRTIAFLRRRGHRVAFEDFYEHPTPALLSAAALAAPDHPRPRAVAATAERRRRLAPAQRWLFRQPVDEPRHWNQSVVLRCAVRVDPRALSAALAAVLGRHPALRQPVGPGGPGEPRPVADLDVVSHSSIRPTGPAAVAETVRSLCTELHRSLDPEAGRLLRVHLFAGGPGVEDRLAVIAHHLVVDGLSWRILLDDLAAAYRAELAGAPAELPPTADFYEWAAASPPDTAAVHGAVAPLLPVDDPTGDAEPATLTWTLDERATERLVARHGRAQRLEAVLLSAFADAMADWSGQPSLGVEVETHGRDTHGRGTSGPNTNGHPPAAQGTSGPGTNGRGPDAHGTSAPRTVPDAGRYLDTVGWFTAVKWVALDAPGDRSGERRIREAEERLHRAAQLPMDVDGIRPEVAFNYLGTFRLPDEPSLGWSVADEQAGSARCTTGDTLYRVRLTARVVGGRLVTDLVYAWPRLSHENAERVFAGFARTVAAAADAAPAPYARAAVSTSGQLLHTGAPAPRGRWRVVREPVHALLTGATGYLGGHLLTELAERGARVTCLVRGESDAAAVRRLGGAAGTRGVDVIAGDIDREGLGLSPAGLARAREAQVVVHAAADTRLVASPTELERTNNLAVRRLLAWIDAEAPAARFHHVSTLAVSGGVDGPVRRFSEADLRIGQVFRTPYERAKFRAEETVRAWALTGRQAYIHRSGHIAAHSRTGAFQRNVQDNRIYQTVRGYILAGAAPSRPSTTFEFSHVDTVAAGIAAIAAHPHAAPGVYHVETPHTVAHDELVDWMIEHGYPISLTDDDTFAAALARAERDDPMTARLASTWFQLGDRNVAVDSAWTTSVLDRLGVRFAEPSARWWSAALTWAATVGFLPASAPAPQLTR